MKSRKGDKNKIKGSPLRLKGKKDKLLARWTDGLFYFVKVTKISEASRTCTVEFEDRSTTTVHFKDLLEEKEDGVVECHCCGKSDFTPSNILVQCSNCEREYHQLCHIPAIPADLKEEERNKFICRICVFATCAQLGGAKKSGPIAEKYAIMKRYFSYDIQHLTWNATHTSNVEQCFCYCGGPGIWYNKMLQCCRCRQWFHEACLQYLTEELLLGDRFYIFACAHCNQGEEFIQRMDLSWCDIAYISMFHLIMTAGKRYIDIDTDIVPFIMSKAHSFSLKKLLNGLHGSKEALRSELLKVLHKFTSLFCCGAEVKKRCTYYGIRERIPPCPTSIQLPPEDEKITASSLAQGLGKKAQFHPSKYSLQVPYILRGTNKVVPPRVGAKLRESKLAKIARVKSEHNYCTPLKSPESSPSRTRAYGSPLRESMGLGAGSYRNLFDANNNSPSKHLPIKTEPGTEMESDIDVVSADSDLKITSAEVKEKQFWSLDTAFPEPLNYLGANHPFLTEFEQENLRKQRQHFEKQLDHLSSLLMDEAEEEDGKNNHPLISSLGTPPSTIKDLKGFKGELADLISATCSNGSTPKKTKTLPDKNLTPDKFLEIVNPTRNRVLARRNGSPSLVKKDSCNSTGSSLSSLYVNGKISPNGARAPLKNGLIHVKSEASTSRDKQTDECLDKAAQKRLKALNRCLKNLTPTCGFRFPVLEENHPAVSHIGPLLSSSSEGNKVAQTHSSVPAVSPARSLSIFRKGKRGRKRKFEPVGEDNHLQEQSFQNAENVRRSHRSRHCVKRFEANLGCKTYEFLDTVEQANSQLNEAEHYEIISLRMGAKGELVEYLVTWSY